jgi:iron complex transport system substrate-binding protein
VTVAAQVPAVAQLSVVALLVLFLAAGCGEQDPVAAASTDRPARVVSLDVCADQYLLKLVDRERILALSPDATAAFSYLRAAAAGLPRVRPLAEDVLLLKPDAVVRSYAGDGATRALFERAGVQVIDIAWASSLDDVFEIIAETAAALGESDRGDAVIARMHRRLARLEPREPRATALYMTPYGVTTGPGSLIHDLFVTAGLRNFQERPGWQPLPLERLAYERPDLVAAAFFDSSHGHTDRWSAMRHPVARARLHEQPSVSLHGAWVSCGGWYLLDAVEALAAAPGTGAAYAASQR